ncbi:MAG: CpaD family pilus assembly protein [Proteobacteria bacterium]|nr:CpaD family pilus assembly protein [Pseudomonadota bacterium]
MIKFKPLFFGFRAALLFAVLTPLLLGACEAPRGPNDYRATNPLRVSKETVSLSLAAPLPENGLAGQAALDLDRFVLDYHRRGRKAVAIKAGKGSRHSMDAAGQVRDMLVRGGVSAREISIEPGGFEADAVVLTFNAFKVKVPECGKWSSVPTLNVSNRNHSNFGCATQRNLGLMVQDPGDLDRSSPMPGADGTRYEGVIGNYRTAPSVSGSGSVKK